MLWLDAALSYLHFTAIFVFFAFMSVEVVLLRGSLDAGSVRLLVRSDIWYWGSAIATLVTGFARLGFGAKGFVFYIWTWPFWLKMALFLGVVFLSLKPTFTFTRWLRETRADPAWRVPGAEQAAMRKRLMLEVHIAAVIPAMAVIMARGLGR